MSLLMSADDAAEWSESIGQVTTGGWRQVVLAVRMGVPEELGLEPAEWAAKYMPELGRVPRKELPEAAQELRDAGLSQRESGAVLGVGQATISRTLQLDSNESEPDPEPVSSQVDELPSWGKPQLDSNESEPEDDWPEEPEPEPEAAKPTAHVGRNSGDNEWYTPAEYIKAARAVMGRIELDPASSDAANSVVDADEFYTEDDDGLTQPWHGRVWMNPPYAQPLIDRFCTRIAREFDAGTITEACVLVNNGTETGWFQAVAAHASAMCFPRGRVRFWQPGKESASPLQGQVVMYLGQHVAEFRAEFLRFGFVVTL